MYRTMDAEAPNSALTVAHIVYGLHALAIVSGILGSATVIGSFIGSVPSIVAVILNYIKRGDARGSWLESHYSWQIRTFWFALLWFLVSVAMIMTVLLAPVGIILLILMTVWIVYRIGRGWLRLNDRRPMMI
ncbi:MAG: hypothetical protein AAGI15_09560 [Pseudomonadota bacterium]